MEIEDQTHSTFILSTPVLGKSLPNLKHQPNQGHQKGTKDFFTQSSLSDWGFSPVQKEVTTEKVYDNGGSLQSVDGPTWLDTGGWAVVSSVGGEANLTIDGNNASYWEPDPVLLASARATGSFYLELDLQEHYQLDRLSLTIPALSGGSTDVNFQLWILQYGMANADGVIWTDARTFFISREQRIPCNRKVLEAGDAFGQTEWLPGCCSRGSVQRTIVAQQMSILELPQSLVSRLDDISSMQFINLKSTVETNLIELFGTDQNVGLCCQLYSIQVFKFNVRYANAVNALIRLTYRATVNNSLTVSSRLQSAATNGALGSLAVTGYRASILRQSILSVSTPLDLVFLLDGSNTVTPQNFWRAKTFLTSVIGEFRLGPRHTQVSVFQYGGVVRQEFTLNTYQDHGALAAGLAAITQLSGPRLTGAALQYAVRNGFSAPNGGGRNVGKVLVLLSTGPSSDSVQQAASAAARAGIVVYAIGVGPSANMYELQGIALSASTVYTVNNFYSLAGFRNELSRRFYPDLLPSYTSLRLPMNSSLGLGRNPTTLNYAVAQATLVSAVHTQLMGVAGIQAVQLVDLRGNAMGGSAVFRLYTTYYTDFTALTARLTGGGVMGNPTVSSSMATSEALSTSGREFLVAFTGNDPRDMTNPRLYISSSNGQNTSVTVSAGLGAFQTTVTVSGSQVSMVEVPSSLVMYGSEPHSDRVISVTSTEAPVTLYGLVKELNTIQPYIVLPKSSLGTEYLTVMYTPRNGYLCQFTVAATENNTNIVIRPMVTIEYSGLTINRGEPLSLTIGPSTIAAIQIEDEEDLSGTYITSDKPIAVYSGNQFAEFPGSPPGGHIQQQLSPVSSWGRTFIIHATAVNVFRVTAAFEFTTVTLTNGMSQNIDVQSTWEFELTSEQYLIMTSTQPIQVVVFQKGRSVNNIQIGPTMLTLSPTEQWASTYSLTTLELPGVSSIHYLVLFVRSADISGLRFEGGRFPLGTVWRTIPNSDLSWVMMQISPGTARVWHVSPLARFGAYVWARAADGSSFAVPAGYHLAPLTMCDRDNGTAGDGKDNDCDGLFDEELPNGIDDDMDGTIDEADMSLNPCDRNPCSNGVCEETRGGYQCRCDTGFSGFSCDISLGGLVGPTWLLSDPGWVVEEDTAWETAGNLTLDVDNTTCWDPGSGTPYLTFQLGSPHTIFQVRFTGTMPSDFVPKSVMLQVRHGPGGNWTDVKTLAIPETLNGPISFGGFSATGQHWRLHVSETHSGLENPQVCELQFFGQEVVTTSYTLLPLQETFTESLADTRGKTALAVTVETNVLNYYSTRPDFRGLYGLQVTDIKPLGAYTAAEVSFVSSASQVMYQEMALQDAVAMGTVNNLAVINDTGITLTPRVPSCTVPTDLVFAIDGTVSANTFTAIVAFIRRVVQSFTIGPEATLVSVVQGGSTPRLEFPLNQFQSLSELLQGLDTIEQTDMPGQGRRFSHLGAFTQENGGRTGVNRLAVFFTDGVPNADDFQRTSENDVVAFTIALGDATSLEGTVSPSSNYVFRVSDSYGLVDLGNRIPKRLCEVGVTSYLTVTLDVNYTTEFLATVSPGFTAINLAVRTTFLTGLQSVFGFQAVQVVNLIPGPLYSTRANIRVIAGTYALDAIQQRVFNITAAGQFGSYNFDTATITYDQIANQLLFGYIEVRTVFMQSYRDQFSTSYRILASSVKLNVLRIFGSLYGVRSLAVTNIKPGTTATTTWVDFQMNCAQTAVPNIVSTYLNVTDSNQMVGTLDILAGSGYLSIDAPRCGVEMDLVLVLDDSGSVGADNFNTLKEFVKRLTTQFDFGQGAIRLGILQYSTAVTTVVSLNSYDTLEDINTAVDDMIYKGGGTNTHLVLYELVNNAFSVQNGGRPTASKVAVVITDGMSTQPITRAVQDVKAAGIIVYTMGVGTGTDQSELQQIASSPDRVFGASNYDSLLTMTGSLANRFCDDGSSVVSVATVDLDQDFSIQLLNVTSASFITLRATVLDQLNFVLGRFANLVTVNTNFQPSLSNKVRVVFTMNCLGYIVNELQVIFNQVASSGTFGNVTITAATFDAQDPRVLYGIVEVNRSFTSELRSISSYEAALLQNFATSVNFARVTSISPGYAATTSLVSFVTSVSANVTDAVLVNFNASVAATPMFLQGTLSPDLPVCPAKLDVVFVLDGSGSVGYDNFQRMKSFVKRVVGGFVIGPSETQISVFQYSHFVVQELALDTYGSIIGINQAIDAVMYQGGGTATGLALYEMRQYGFSLANGGRPGARRVAILLTDGMSTDSVDKHAMAAWQAGISLYVVGIGSNVDMNELLAIGGTPDNVFSLDNFGQLQDLSNRLPSRLCEPGIMSIVNPATTQLGNLTVESVDVRDDDSLSLFVMVEVNYTYTPGLSQPNSAVFASWTNIFENTATSLIADVTLIVSQPSSIFVQTALVAGFRSGDIRGHPVIGGTVSTSVQTCPVKLDLVFILDSSDSVDLQEFNMMRRFLIKTAGDFNIGPDATQVGLVQYADAAETKFALDSFDNPTSLMNAIQSIQHTGGTANTGNALDHTVQYMFASRNGARQDSTKIAILLTGGASSDGVRAAAQTLRKSNVITYAIGIGNGVDYDQLDYIAGAPTSLTILRSASDLIQLRNTLPRQLCQVSSGVPYIVNIPINTYSYSTDYLDANTSTSLQLYTQLNEAMETWSPTHHLPTVHPTVARRQQLGPFPRSGLLTSPRTGLAGGNSQSSALTQPPDDDDVHVLPGNSVAAVCQMLISPYAVTDVTTRFQAFSPQGGLIQINTAQIRVIEERLRPIYLQLQLVYNFTLNLQSRRSSEFVDLSLQLENVFYLMFVGDQSSIASISVVQIGPGLTDTTITVDVEFQAFDAAITSAINIIENATATGVLGQFEVIDYIIQETAPTCQTQLDLVFVLVGTENVGEENFEKQKSFVKKIISDFDIGPDSTQISIIQYAEDARMEIALDTYSDDESIQRQLDDIKYIGGYGSTMTGRAIDYASRFGFSPRNGARALATKVAVLFTYGMSNDDVAGPALNMRKGNVFIYGIAVGSNATSDQIISIAGTSNNLRRLANFNDLNELRNTLPTQICGVGNSVQRIININIISANFSVDLLNPQTSAWMELFTQLDVSVLNQFSAMQGTVDIVSLRVTQILPGSTATTTTVDVEVVTTASQVSSVQGRLTNITAPGQILGGATVISSQVALTAPVCSVRVDLVFVLDGTGSVGADNFEIMKTFVQKMISDFEIGSEATRIGVVVYSHRAELAISLDAFEDGGALQDAVAAIAYPGGYTRTGAAIDYTTTSAFSTRNGAREGVVRVAIILTDGISYDDPSEPAQSMRKAAIITYAVGIGSNLDRDQLDVIAGVPENLMMLDNFSMLDNLRTTLPGRVCAGATSEQILIRILITSTRFDVSLLNANSTAFQTILYQINTASASVLDLHATLLLDVMAVTTFLASFQFLGYFPGVPGFTAPLVSLAPGPTGDSVVAMCLGWVPAFASNTVRSGLLNVPAQLNNLTIDTTFTSVVAAPGTSVVFARLVVNVTYTAEYQVRGSAAYDALILRLQYQVLNQFSAMQGTVDIVSLRVTQILPGSTATTTTVDVEVVTTASQVSSVQGRLTNITAPGQILGGATVISSQVALTAPVCSVRVDLVFVLDGTGSVGADNFERMKTFVQKMISDFEIGSEATRIGVVVYSHRAELAISLDAFEDGGALQDAVAAIAYPGGYTRTGAAIDYTTTSAFSTRNGAREGVVRVAIILTDGISYDDPSEPAQSMRKAAIITYAVGIGSNLDRDQLDVIAGVPENLMMLDNFSMLDNLRTTLPGRVCAGATSEQILIRILITSTRFDVSLLNANSTAFQTILYQINTASASVLDLHATLLLDVMDVTTFLASFQFLGYFPGVPGFTAPLVSLAPGPTGDSVVAMCLGWVPAFASNTVRSGLLNAPAQLNNLTIDTTFTSVVAAPGTSVVFARLVVNVNYTAEYQVRGSAAYDALILRLQYQVLNQFSAMQGTVDIVSLRVTQILPGSTATTTTVDVEVVTTASQVSSVQGRLTNITAPGQILGGATVISSQVALTAPVCSVRVDLVFVLDGTGSVGADNFERMKTFVQKMISDFEIGSEATRIGVVVYSHRAELAISLDAFEDGGALQDAVAAIAYPGGYTRTGAAIDYTTTSAFSTRNGAREGVVRVAIILTDGISYDDPSEPAQSMRKAAIITYAVGIGSNLDRDQLDVIAGVPENLMMLDNFSMLDNLRTTLPGRVCAGATSEQILIRILITSTRFDVSLLNANSTAFQTILYQINTASASVLDLHATLLLDVMDVTTFLASFQFLGYFPGVPGFTAPLVSLAPGPTGDSVVAMCLGWVPAFASNTVRSGLLNVPAQLNNLTIDTTFTSVVAAPGTSVVFARLVVNVNYTAEYQVRGSAAYDALILRLQYQVLNQFSAMQGTVDIVSLRVTQILPGSTATTTTVDVEVVTTASQVSSVQGRLTNITAPGQILGGATVISSQVALTAPVCSVRVDLVFVLDGTGSVGADNFERMKTFVQKMISDFEIGSEATRIGVVVYSHRAELAISLDAFEDGGALQDAVAAIAYPGGYTRTGAAIDYTTTSAFSTRNGAREGVVRVAIILTDGISYDDPSEPAQSMRKAAIITYAVGIGSNLDRDQLDVIAGVPENLMMLDNFSMLDNLRTTLPGRVCAGATSEQILIRILITSTRFDVSLLNANSTAFQTILYQINTASASVLDLHATLLLDVMDVTTFLASFQFLGYFPGVPGFTAPLVSLAPGPTGDSVVAMCLGWVPAFASNTVRSGLLTAPAQLNNLTIDTTFTSVVAAPGTSVVFARLVVNVNYTAEYQVRGSAAYDALILRLQYQVLNQFSAMQGTVDIVSLRVTQILPGSTATTTTVDVEVVTTASQVSSVQGRLTNITAPGQILGGATVISSQVALTAPVCSVRVDLVFVLDGTGSVGADNFERMKTFVQKMISDFEIGSEATRIGVVVYSHRAELAISLDAFEDGGALQDAVAAIAYPGGYTRTGAAIDYTTTSAFSTRNGAREGVVRVAIILTDGISYDDPSEPAQSMRKAAIITYAVGIGSNLDRDQLDVIAGVPENLMMLDNFSMLDNLRTTLPGRVCAGATSEQILIRILITSTRFDVSLLNANSTAFQTILYQINTASASVLDLHATLLLDVMDVTTFLASFQFLGYFPGVPGFTAPLVSLAPGPTGDSVVAMCLGWVPAFASNTVRSGLLTAPAQLNNLTIDTTFTSVVAAPGTSVVFARLVVNVNYTAEYQVRGSAAYDALILRLQYQVKCCCLVNLGGAESVLAMQGTVDTSVFASDTDPSGSTATTTTVDVE
ncbi:biological adhesion, partial [Branchiostoma belcheri]